MRVVLFLIDTYIETVHQCSISCINLDVSCLCRIYFREIYKDISQQRYGAQPPGIPGVASASGGQPGGYSRLKFPPSQRLFGFPACSRWQLSLRLAVGSPPFRVDVSWLFSQSIRVGKPATSSNLRKLCHEVW